MFIEKRIQVIVMWLLVLFGMVFHSLLEILPLFFGESIAIAGSTGSTPAAMVWLSLFFYLLPMLMIFGLTISDSFWVIVINLIVAVLFLLANFTHFIEDSVISSNYVQLILLGSVLVFSIFTAIFSYQLLKEE